MSTPPPYPTPLPVSPFRAVSPAANAPKFKVTFNVEGSNAEDLLFKLNVVSDPVKPPPSSLPLPGSSIVRSLSEQVASAARFAYSLFDGIGSNSGGGGSTGSSGSSSSSSSSSDRSGRSSSSGSGGGSEWPGCGFICSMPEQAAEMVRLAYSFLGRTTSNSGSSSTDIKSSPGAPTEGGKRAGPFKAFSLWWKKQRDAAEDFVDGPGV